MAVGIMIAIFYGLSFIALIILGILSWFIWDKRFKSKQQSVQVPAGFQKTDEIFIDPTTNKRISVYYNPITAERFYKDEN